MDVRSGLEDFSKVFHHPNYPAVSLNSRVRRAGQHDGITQDWSVCRGSNQIIIKSKPIDLAAGQGWLNTYDELVCWDHTKTQGKRPSRFMTLPYSGSLKLFFQPVMSETFLKNKEFTGYRGKLIRSDEE